MFNRFQFRQNSSYSRWDGSQQIEDLSADDIVHALADDYLRNNDLRSALKRLQREGFQKQNGENILGLREMLERLRAQRQMRLNQYNMSGVMDDIKQKIEDIIQKERDGIQKRLDEAGQTAQNPPSEGGEPSQQSAASSDDSLKKMLEKIAGQKLDFLNALPQDPAGKISKLAEYDFLDPEARSEYQELLNMLQQQIMQQYFQGMQQSIANMTPEDLRKMREMLQELNHMMREREEGREPDFDEFMRKYGDYFGSDVNTLDDLIDDLQRRSAQMQAVLDSLPEEQREQLMQMMDQLLGDDRIRVDMAELAMHVQNLGPNDYQTRYRFGGDEPLSLTEALNLMERLQGLDDLESQMMDARRNSSLDDIDTEKMADLMSAEDGAMMEELKNLMKILEEEGYIEKNGSQWKLTSLGIRKIGQKALQDIFQQLSKDSFGQHPIEQQGAGSERLDESKPYQFGDPFFMDLPATLRNAIYRNSAGTPVKLSPDDFEVYKTETITESSTALLIDMSISMIQSGANEAAKKVAVALESLIHGQFPRDNLFVIGFSSTAREFHHNELVEIGVYDHSQGTNMIHAFMLAKHLLSRNRSINKQIILVTDGMPTVSWDNEEKDWIFTYPYTQVAEMQTLLEARRCAREGIVINTFMLAQDRGLITFVQSLTEVNKGRAFYCEPENLGKYILVDYLSGKKSSVIRN